MDATTAEGRRLAEDAARTKNWKRWGPYLSERQWATVREAYMKALYRYPQAEFPYAQLVDENRRRGSGAPEFELADTGLFGGNSNWRGPIWFPVNYLIVEALERYHHHYGDGLKVELPTGSGRWCNLQQVADEKTIKLSGKKW